MSTVPVLPADIHLLILDYIQLPSHLKALCLTSKAYCNLARPRLYRKVSINVFDPDEVKRFERCMDAGAQAHLDATRSLTMMDSLPPPEAPEFQVKPHRHFYHGDELKPAEIDRIKAVLAYFPSNRLHSFRFLSTIPFDTETARDLFLRQAATLTHLHLGLDNFALLNLVQCIRTADIWLPNVRDSLDDLDMECLEDFFSQISSYKRMERLFLGSKSRWARDHDPTLSEALLEPAEECGRLESLRELTLFGIPLKESFYEGLTEIISFSQLTSLTLWGCDHTRLFISTLADELGDQNLPLKHLALDIYSYNDLILEDEDAVETLLGRCTELRSLCLQWGIMCKEYSTESLVRSLKDIGQQLVLLSLHVTHAGEHDSEPGCLEEICLACPNLEQFGYNISDAMLANFHEGVFYPSLLPICQLSKLRTLHLRQGFCYDYGFVDEYLDPDIEPADIPSEVHRFAKDFFAHLEEQSSCPSLDTLVIGQETQAKDGEMVRRAHDDPWERKLSECEPARCFRRNRAICDGETVRDAYHLMSLAEFRATSSHAEILDWYTTWNGYMDWMWRLPGRFNDD